MSNVQNVLPVLANLGALKANVQAKWKQDDAQWQAFSAQFEGLDKGTFQFSPTALADLEAFRGQDWADRKLFVDLVTLQNLVGAWAQNEDSREGLGIPDQLPYPAIPDDVQAAASAASLSLLPQPPAPPKPVVSGMMFAVPGGFTAVIGPQWGGTMYYVLSGDTVPSGMVVNAPDGHAYTRHSSATPFGQENWYTINQ